MRWVLTIGAAALSLLSACDDGSAVDRASGLGADIVITALDAAAADTVWDIEIVGPVSGASPVWRGRVLSPAGHGVATVSVPCDGGGENRARIWLVGTYAPGVRAARIGAFSRGQASGDGAVDAVSLPFVIPTAPVVRDFVCSVGARPQVELDLVLARPAADGFFDRAVTFGDVVCVARLDCCDDFGGDGCAADGSEDIALLHDADGNPGRTIVLAFACADRTAGSAPTLYLDDVTLDCDPGDGLDDVDVAVRPGVGPSGTQCKAGPDGLSRCGAIAEADGFDADAILFQIASYRGLGELRRSNDSLRNVYWNVQLGVRAGISKCQLRARATAGLPWDAGVVEGVVDAGFNYPQVVWDVPLGSCGEEVASADGSPDASVRVDYLTAGSGAWASFDYAWSLAEGARPVCASPCLNGGACVAPGVCACDGTGFSGPRCERCGELGVACADGFACTPSGACASPSTHEVEVPDGAVWMGCDAGTAGCGDDEGPRHYVALSAFAIDAREVTAAAYHACVDAGACDAPVVVGGAYGTYGDPGRSDHPVTFVSWEQAASYCAWPDKPAGEQRLCTEAEWERAARGGCDGAGADCAPSVGAFPWGNDAPDCKRGNFYSLPSAGYCRPGTYTAPVGATPLGDSRYGASDMAGNVAEWVADWYGPYVAAWDADPRGPSAGTERVIRGGSYTELPSRVRAAARAHARPDAALHDVGFRCCRSLPPAEGP